MKKFLSVLLAVMMVLSTVSFAAPTAVDTYESFNETVVDFADLAAEEDTAVLSSDEIDYASLGKLILNVDFENLSEGDVLSDYVYFENLVDEDDYDPEFINASFRTQWEAGANTIAVEADGNKYIRGGQGYAQVRLDNQKYGLGSPDGVYTYVIDAIDFGIVARGIGYTTQSSWVNGSLVQAEVSPVGLKGWSGGLNTWETVAAVWNGVANDMTIYFTDDATTEVGFDNLKLYYRPETVIVTIDGTDYEISTDRAYSADDLAAYVAAPTGYTLSGVSLTEGGELLTGEQYFFEDTTLYPTYEKDTTIHEVYGQPLFIIDFEREDMQGWYGHTQDVENTLCNHGAKIYEIATKYDARFEDANFRVRFLINEGTHVDQETVVDADGNHYTQGTTQTQWPQISINNWDTVTGEAGVYTFSVDTKSSIAAVGRGYGSWTVVDPLDMVANEWDKVVVQQTLTAEGNIPSGMAMNYDLGSSYAGTTVAFDNAILYYKPNTVDVTLVVDGEEYVAEDVATTGVSASSILEKAGVSAPYGTKPVLSAMYGGESVGNIINLVMDSRYYVSFVEDDSIHPTYGKRLFLIDLENFEAGDVFDETNGQKAVSYYTDDCDASFANATVNWEVGANTIAVDGDNTYITGQQGWAQVRINNSNYASLPAGKYTMEYKSKNLGYPTEAKAIAATDQANGTSCTIVDGFTDNGEWDTVAAYWNACPADFTLYYTGAMTTDVAFDDVAIYYIPESVNLTIVNGDETITKEGVVNGTTAEEILSDIVVPFGYKIALSTTGKEEDVIEGALTLVSDATLYVVTIPDAAVSFDYGELVYEFTFDGKEFVEDNGYYRNNNARTLASYYNEDLTTSSDLFQVSSTGTPTQEIVTDGGSEVYHGKTGGTWKHFFNLVKEGGNSKWGEGTFALAFDLKTDVTTSFAVSQNSSSFTTPDPYSFTAGEYDHVVVLVNKDFLTSKYQIELQTSADIEFWMDNVKLYYKPNTATVTLSANGEAVSTVEDVDTAGVLASTLVEGVKVKGYAITGVKLGTISYELTDTVVVPCDCTIELVLEVQETPAATPETDDAARAIRVDQPMGIRFKASLANAELENITSYGWIVARADVLGEDELTLDYANKVVGYGRKDSTDLKNFFESDDEYSWFTGVLYFSAVEDDGLPAAERLAAELVARPFAVVDGEALYGAATTPTSIFKVVLDFYYDENGYDAADGSVQEFIDSILEKVDSDANDIPDCLE